MDANPGKEPVPVKAGVDGQAIGLGFRKINVFIMKPPVVIIFIEVPQKGMTSNGGRSVRHSAREQIGKVLWKMQYIAQLIV